MRRGFTLVELLVSLAIIATLAAVSGAVYSAVKRAAFNARCTASLSQLGAATWLYLAEHDNLFFPYAQNTAAGKGWSFGGEASGGRGADGDR
jgi:prepilin-type N-terminal cleavage/methylation domain-containing protein